MAGRRRSRSQWLAPVIIFGSAAGFIIALASGGEPGIGLFAIGSAVMSAVMVIVWLTQRFFERLEGNAHPEPVPVRVDQMSNWVVNERSEQ